jgi:starch-binding outer membrane protein, SusD/RagB family
MKLNKLTFLMTACFAFFIIAGLSSCRKYELEPVDWFGRELVFDTMDANATVAAFFFDEIYNYIPGGFTRIGGDFLDASTDDAVPSRNNTLIEYYAKGQVSVVNNPDPYWANSYFGIRKATLFLANIDKVAMPDPVQDPSRFASEKLRRQYWRAEARFLRAYFYWELLKRYGGVPLLGDRLLTLEDDIEIPRNTFDDCVNYIVSECDKVKDSLRKEPIAEWGRVPRGAAVALKCRVYLYAASPLYNGGGIETDPAKKALTGYLSADPGRWQKVIDAAEEFKALGFYGLQPTFSTVFTTKQNTEVIFAKQSANSTNLETTQSPVGYNTASVTSQGLTSPSQNLADAFLMRSTGLPASQTGSGYNPANPFAANSKDSRFDATFFYNGVRWLSRPVETNEGGKDKPNVANVQVQTKTGYYLRKFLGDFTNSTSFSSTSHNFIHFRYAEILMNYAEALNEMGRVEDAVNQVKLIRARASVAAGTNTRYGIKVGITQAEMRDLIRNERRIEFAFEEHRFWDVRRWKIASQVLNTVINGMKITGSGTSLTYQVVPVTSIFFTNRLYHMPLPFDEITKNRNLVQNEGW